MSDTSSSKWEELEEQTQNCRQCPRLVSWREEVSLKKRRAFRDQPYWGKPVPGLGDRHARVLVIGLAPGAHGSNRTGRMFTGDASGIFLFSALHKFGFASQPDSIDRFDKLEMKDMYITSVCRCVPPKNKPAQGEIDTCLPYLQREIDLLFNLIGIVALGRIAFDNTIKVYRNQHTNMPRFSFTHGTLHHLGPELPWLISSYHPSRQNTQTGRLTPEMFDSVWQKARHKMDSADA
jgi:uracil-DNA glycosylase